MLLPLLISIVVLAPQTPDADHDRLAALFAKDVETSVVTSAQASRSPTAARARQWRGSGCRGSVELELSGLPSLAYDIDWSRARVGYESGRRTVILTGAAPPTRVPVTASLSFRFKDAETAQTAARAMARRQAACTPQR